MAVYIATAGQNSKSDRLIAYKNENMYTCSQCNGLVFSKEINEDEETLEYFCDKCIND